MDGTLIDSSSVIANAINHVRGKLSLEPMLNKHIVASINNTNIHAPSYFYEAPNFTKAHEDWFQEYYTDHHNIDTALYEGVGELLEKLSNTHALSVATNAYKLSAMQILDANDISKYFDIIMCADIVTNAKPHREMLDVIVEHYGAHRDEFVVIGDGERDIMAAQNAGIDSILVDWGFSEHSEAVKSIKELEDILLAP
jgi:phosphoglycolate phosphatase